MRLRRVATVLSIGGVVSLFGCAAAPDEVVEQSEDGLTTYGDLFTTLEGVDLDRWVAVRSVLTAGFDRICGDTICSGDYSNLATVRLICSSAQRQMRDCTWVLGGSIDHIDGATGSMTSEPRVFTCKIPVAGTAPTLLRTLEAAGDDALHTPLPGVRTSFYDGLVDCFAGVTGGPPPAASGTMLYRELGDWFSEGTFRVRAWVQTTRNLAQGFDQVCGDSFCEGEYPDITPLRFVCSMNLETKYVSRCSWSFALADISVGARGRITVNATTQRCEVDIGTSASELKAALSGPDPLNAMLPGKTTSIYDALIGCL